MCLTIATLKTFWEIKAITCDYNMCIIHYLLSEFKQAVMSSGYYDKHYGFGFP